MMDSELDDHYRFRPGALATTVRAGVCPECGNSFCQQGPGRRAIYCSARCRKRAWEHRRTDSNRPSERRELPDEPKTTEYLWPGDDELAEWLLAVPDRLAHLIEVAGGSVESVHGNRRLARACESLLQRMNVQEIVYAQERRLRGDNNGYPVQLPLYDPFRNVVQYSIPDVHGMTDDGPEDGEA